MKIVRSLKADPHPSIIGFDSFIITPSYALYVFISDVRDIRTGVLIAFVFVQDYHALFGAAHACQHLRRAC